MSKSQMITLLATSYDFTVEGAAKLCVLARRGKPCKVSDWSGATLYYRSDRRYELIAE